MKKILAGALCAAMAVTSLGMVSFADETGLATEGTLVVGFDAEYPPYGYMDDNGDYTGFDLELAAAVCDIEGWEMVPMPIDWDSKDMELDSGDNSQVIVTASDSGISSLEDLEGKIVGVQADSAALALLDEGGDQEDLGATFGEMQQFGDYNTAFAELEAGSLDAVAIDIGVANYQIAGRDEFVILDEYLNSEQYAVGFKKGNDALCNIINEDLEVLLTTGVFNKIAAEYEDMGIPSDMLCLAESLGLEEETEA